ncbi:MAG: solute-binding protein [Verrucomicrobia bacterium]|nr:solute-binding protein [Verrucomicrobiota bacterium]
MKQLAATLCIWVLHLLLFAGCGVRQTPLVTLYAGAGLRPAVESIRVVFEARTGIALEVDYAGSGVILARVQDDPLADLFLPGDAWYVERLQALNGSVVETVSVARLIPVLAVAPGNPKCIRGLRDLSRPDVTAALGHPKACQIGRTARGMLGRVGLDWDAVADKESLTVNELVTWVKMNDVDVALVWDSTARAVGDSVDLVPVSLQAGEISPVTCALLSTSRDRSVAQSFMHFMAGEEGQRLLRENGYSGVVE